MASYFLTWELMHQLGKDVFYWARKSSDLAIWVAEQRKMREGEMGILFRSLQHITVSGHLFLENEILKQKMKKGMLAEGERTSAQVDVLCPLEIFSLKGENCFIWFLAFDMDHPMKFFQFMHCHWPEGEGRTKQQLFVDIYYKLLDDLEEWNGWDKEERYFWEALVKPFRARVQNC